MKSREIGLSFSLAPDPLMEKLPVLTAISAAKCGAKLLPSAI